MMTRSLITLAATTACLQTAMAMEALRLESSAGQDSSTLRTIDSNDSRYTTSGGSNRWIPSNDPQYRAVAGGNQPRPGFHNRATNVNQDTISDASSNHSVVTNTTQGGKSGNTSAKTPFQNLYLATGLLAAAAPAAFVASEYGVKNLMGVGNEEVTKALGVTGDEFTKAQLEQHDLHDVLFKNLNKLEDVDVNTMTQDNFAQLTGQIYLYFMIGGAVLTLFLIGAIMSVGLNKTSLFVGLGVAAFTLGGSAITAAGFSAILDAEAGYVWTQNPTIWVGVAFVGLSFIAAAVYLIVSCRKPKVDPMQQAYA